MLGAQPRQLAAQSDGSCKRHLEPAGFQVPGPTPTPSSPSPPLPPSSQLSQLSSNAADGPTIIFETPLSAKIHSPPPPDSPPLTLVTPQLSCPFFDPLFFSNLVARRRPPSPSRATTPTKPRRIASPFRCSPDRRPTPERPQPAPQPCPTRVIGMRQLLLHVRGGGQEMGGNRQPRRPSPAPGTAMRRRRPSPCDTRTWCRSQRLLLTLPRPARTDGPNPRCLSSDANPPWPSPPPTMTRLPTMVPTRPMPPPRSA